MDECVYTINVAGAEDQESTYHIWEAMVALDDMCARFGEVGTAYGLGLLLPSGRLKEIN